MQNKKIGIILVNYNGLQDTKECIKSIYKSSYKNYFIIVVDNASRESCDELDLFNNVILKRLKNNVGFGIANNIGAEVALDNGADCILCLNNDTEIASDMLERMIGRYSESEIQTAATYFFCDRSVLWYGGGEVSRLRGTFRHKQYITSRNVTFVSGCCMLVSAKCIREIGLFEKEYFMYYEDADFSLKALSNGYSLFYNSEAILWHKVGRSIDREPGMKDYYITRNRLYILKKYEKQLIPFSKLYFWVSRLLIILIGKLKGYDISPYLEGIKDYRNGKMGIYASQEHA